MRDNGDGEKVPATGRRKPASMRRVMVEFGRRWRTEFGRDTEYTLAVEVLRIGRMITRDIERVLRGNDLTMAQWTILTVLYFAADQQMPLGKIADTVSVHPSTVGNAVDVLETAGWIRRDLPDRRTILAKLTPVGARRLQKVQSELIAARFGLELYISETDAKSIHRALALLRAHGDPARDGDAAPAPGSSTGPVVTKRRSRTAETEPASEAPRGVRTTA